MRAVLLLPLFLGLSVTPACQRADERESAPVQVCPEVDAGTVVDPALLAFLSRARAAHHLADLAEEKKDLDEALRVLTEFAKDKPPPDRAEAEEVLADTYARVAELESQLGRFDAANANVERGLGFAKGTTYYLGHLFEIKGVVAERRAKKLRADGEAEAARLAERDAVKAFERSMQIQEKVLDELLKSKDDAPPK